MLKARTSRVAVAGSTSASTAAVASRSDADQVPDLLDEVEQLRALLAYERPAEQDAQLVDVASQIGLRVGLEREATRRQSVHQS